MQVIFFPRAQYPVEICAHRLGKSMTYTEQSDGFRGGAENIVSYAAGKGIKVGVFWIPTDTIAYRDIALPYIDDGMMWIDAYCFPAGSDGGVVTQEAYDEARDLIINRVVDWFGTRPIAMSYAYGNQTYVDMIVPDFLAGRNSGKEGGTPYGVGYGLPSNIAYSMANYKTRQSSSRWYDDAKVDSSFSTRLAQLATDVATTKSNGGWYNNFTHWHNVISDGNIQAYKDYFDLLAQLNANNDIYFAGYGEAVAYLAFRQLITRAVMYSPNDEQNSLIIRLEAINTLGIDTKLLQIPVSVKFTTQGTPLEGMQITSDRNLISLGNNNYIVEIPYAYFPVAKIVKLNP